jgi:hypothetical protein
MEKIYPYDILVLFLKCVQFLMDTILNLAIVQFLMKKKGRHALWGRVSYLNKRETRVMRTCLLSQ